MLEVNNLTKQFDDLLAVNDVSFTATRGQVFGLLGPNGAGKSTAINCIAGLLSPTSGQVSIDGADIQRDARRARQSLGVVPQELALYDDLPAIDNLSFWGRAYGLGGSELADRVALVLEHIGLADRARDLPASYSGGMKRRLNFGCGIVHRPRLLLLDEPTVGVDPQSRGKLLELVEKERDNGVSVVYTTHYMEEAERLCDKLAIIDHGKLIAEGSVEELRAQLGARDVLQLSGQFPEGSGARAVARLHAANLPELSVVSDDADGLVLSLKQASQHLPAVFQALDAEGAVVAETSLRRSNLETLFLLLTGKDLRE